MNYEQLAEKVKEIIIKKKPSSLVVNISEDEALIYTDQGLECKFQPSATQTKESTAKVETAKAEGKPPTPVKTKAKRKE